MRTSRLQRKKRTTIPELVELVVQKAQLPPGGKTKGVLTREQLQELLNRLDVRGNDGDTEDR